MVSSAVSEVDNWTADNQCRSYAVAQLELILSHMLLANLLTSLAGQRP